MNGSAQFVLPFDTVEHAVPERALSVSEPASPPSTHAAPPAPTFTRHPRARRYLLRVGDDGGVRVTLPRWGSRREAVTFMESQQAWIEAQRRRIERVRAEASTRPRLEPEAERAYRERAVRELPERLTGLASSLGLTVSRISVRNQKWRWGSCSPSGHICLNWRLVMLPDEVRDYVLIHELMHLKRMDHSAKFWKLVERACPEFKMMRRALRAHESLLA